MCDWRHVITFSTIFFVFSFFFLPYRSLSFVRDLILLMISLSLSLCNRRNRWYFRFLFRLYLTCYLGLAVIYFFFFPFTATNWTTDGRSRNVEERFRICIKTDSISRFSFFEYRFIIATKVLCRYRHITLIASHVVLSLLECK